MRRLTRWGFDRESARATRPERLVRPLAYRGRIPIRGRTLAQIDADVAAVLARVEVLEAGRISECRANAGVEAAVHIAAVEPVSRPAGGRSPAATSEPMDATAGETAPVSELVPPPVATIRSAEDGPGGAISRKPAVQAFAPEPAPQPLEEESAAAAEFEAALAKVRAEKMERPREAKPEPVNDFARVAAAYKRQAEARPVKTPPPASSQLPKYQGSRWCEQCDQRKWWPQAAQCKSEFCKIEGAA